MTELRITHLADHPAALPNLAAWFVDEWEPYYGSHGPGDAERDLAACCNRDAIPLALVALDADQKVVGTAALKSHSLETHRHLSPWLAALLVTPSQRGKEIASTLFAAIEQEARRLGFGILYSTPTAIRPCCIAGVGKTLRQVSRRCVNPQRSTA